MTRPKDYHTRYYAYENKHTFRKDSKWEVVDNHTGKVICKCQLQTTAETIAEYYNKIFNNQ